MSSTTVHTVVNGSCVTCTMTAEWLTEHGRRFDTMSMDIPEDVAALRKFLPADHPLFQQEQRKTQDLAVEQANTRTGYGHIHKAGCRDLRDGLPIGAASTIAEAIDRAEDALCWDLDPEEWEFAACVRLPKA